MRRENRNSVELLAPAGNFEKLEIAIHYGADAVYLAGKEFSLRNFSDNFSSEEMADAVALAHGKGVKVYVACNIYSRNFEHAAMDNYLEELARLSPDGLIIADPGIVMRAREIAPEIPIHLSTQSNTTNFNAVRFWESAGVTRVNTARELTLSEIREIADKTSVEIETFVHGAMCISYSGRCLMSSYMAGRDGNRGLCTQPCRWRYTLMEELRPGEHHPVFEDERGTYVFNSKDLCLISHIPELVDAGIDSLKIEGRMKGINYLASAVKVYREALDAYFADPPGWAVREEWIRELSTISHRQYCTGFAFEDPGQTAANLKDDKPAALHLFCAKVLSTEGGGRVRVNIRNKLLSGARVEVLTRTGIPFEDRVKEIRGANGELLPFAQPNTEVTLLLEGIYGPNDILRTPPDTAK